MTLHTLYYRMDLHRGVTVTFNCIVHICKIKQKKMAFSKVLKYLWAFQFYEATLVYTSLKFISSENSKYKIAFFIKQHTGHFM